MTLELPANPTANGWPLSDRRNAKVRSPTIDAARLVAIAAIVVIHSEGALRVSTIAAGSAADSPRLEALCRFAVPFFFLASGYFLKTGPTIWGACRRVFARIVPIYIVWTIVFLICDPAAYQYLDKPSFILRLCLTGGTAPHLWFLSSLMIDMALVIVLQRFVSQIALLAIAILLFVSGLAIGCYHPLLFGVSSSEELIHVARDSPCFGLVFICLGYAIKKRDVRVSLTLALIVLIVSAAMQWLEMGCVRTLADNNMLDFDYSASTLLYGLGAFLTTLELSRWRQAPPWMAYLGRFSLGVYASHQLFVVMFRGAFVDASPLASLALALASIGASLACAMVMAQFRPLQAIVQ